MIGDPVPVAFVSSHATLGGAERYLATILRRLGPAWTSEIVTLQSGPFADRLRDEGWPVTVIHAPARPPGLLVAAWRLRRRLAQGPARVVHANGLKAGLVAVLAAAGTRRRVLWMRHDLAGSARLAGWIAGRCTEVVAVSEAVAEAFPPRARAKVRVIHDGVEGPDGDPEASRGRLHALAGGAPVVVLCGRLCPGKGQADLVDVAPAVIAEHPGARFLLLGGEDPAYPGFRGGLEDRVAGQGLGDAVIFGGHREDAAALVAGAEVLAAPSRRDPEHGWSEGFGLAAAEAMWSGVPVVAYANGSLPEVVGDAGVVVPEGDRDALAAALCEILRDPEQRADLGARGARRVRERFGLDAAVGALAERYRALAGAAA